MNRKASFIEEPEGIRKNTLNPYFNGMIGKNLQFKTPFGEKINIYVDFTASGRAHIEIEKLIKEKVLPYYSNIHSVGVHLPDSIQLYRNNSKRTLREYVNADPQKDVVIFTGQGTTSAINKLISILRLKEYGNFYETLDILRKLDDFLISFDFQEVVKVLKIKERFMELFPKKRTPFNSFINPGTIYSTDKSTFISDLLEDIEQFEPIFFHSHMEHNSNYLPWKINGVKMIQIENYKDLRNHLKKYENNYIKIGSFSAASNVSGKLSDVDKLAYTMHRYGGLAFFDYASGAPYLQMDMNSMLPKEYRQKLGFSNINEKYKELIYKDGLFFSPHKFLGGNNTPGVLICKENILNNLDSSPSQPGGGTVLFVTKDDVHYTPDIEAREESGTPDIIGSIRIGCAINLRKKISHMNVAIMDEIINNYVTSNLNKIENLKILKDFDDETPHLPIYSFLISYGDKYFHQNFISCLLNDLFGIQSRPGCSCAPLYTQFLLEVDDEKDEDHTLQKLEYYSTHGKSIFKPGFTRINFPYFYPKFVIDYVLFSIRYVAKYAHRFLPFYSFDIESGSYTICDKFSIIQENSFNYNKSFSEEDYLKENFDEYMNILNSTKKSVTHLLDKIDSFIQDNEKIQNNVKNQSLDFDKESDKYRWFIIYDDITNQTKKDSKHIEKEYNFSSLINDDFVNNMTKYAKSLAKSDEDAKKYENMVSHFFSYLKTTISQDKNQTIY